MVDRVALHGHASLPPGPTSVPECATPWPSEEDAPRRGTPVWIIYSGCIPREEGGQFSRGGVALIAVVHRKFAFVPSSSLTPVLTATSSTRLLSSRSPPPPPLVRPHPSVAILHQNLFVPRREKHAAVRAAILLALICAQRERRKLMHVAHAGRESVGSLSSRTPALTRIHHRAAGSFDERRIVRRVAPPERGPLSSRGRFNQWNSLEYRKFFYVILCKSNVILCNWKFRVWRVHRFAFNSEI